MKWFEWCGWGVLFGVLLYLFEDYARAGREWPMAVVRGALFAAIWLWGERQAWTAPPPGRTHFPWDYRC